MKRNCNRMASALFVLLLAMAAMGCNQKAAAQTSGQSNSANSAGANSSGANSSAVTSAAEAAADIFSGTVAPASDFRYELNAARNGVVITGYLGSGGGVLIIPSEIEGFPVVEFNLPPVNHGFSNKRISAVVFPDTITEISGPYGAFGTSNTTLTAVKLPKNMKIITGGVFASSRNLTTVIWPESIEIIGNQAFNSTGLTSVELPEGVKEIRDQAFDGCRQLTSVTIPQSIEVIGSFAFNDCSELTTVSLPSKQIRYDQYFNSATGWTGNKFDVFKNCSKLSLATRAAIEATGYTGSF